MLADIFIYVAMKMKMKQRKCMSELHPKVNDMNHLFDESA